MYYDKHFQTNNHFPLIAFNHKQIKYNMTGGFFLVETLHFHDIADWLLNINPNVLEDLTTLMSECGGVKAETEEEKACFQLIKDLDYIGGK